MKKPLIILVVAFLSLNAQAGAAETGSGSLLFKQNKGQWDPQVLYAAELQNGNVFLCHDSFTFMLSDTANLNRIRRAHNHHVPSDMTVHKHVFRQVFDGANALCKLTPGNQFNEYFNYYLGKDQTKWASHVNAFQTIDYQNLYKDINLNVTSEGVNMKYSLIVSPGGDPSLIAMHYVGIDGMSIDHGDLVLKTSIGNITDTKPYAYQIVNGQESQVSCHYEIKDNKVGFSFPDGYDASRPLVIDPTLVFSTYSGSVADNFGFCATFDQEGNTYTAGTVCGNVGTYPVTTGAFQTTWGGGVGFGIPTQFDGEGVDISITKYDSVGHTRIYSTYLGGGGDEMPGSLIVNSNDELFVFGTTGSNNFPVTAHAYDTSFGGGPDKGIINGENVHYQRGSDLFVTHFNIDGTALLASTYVGGSGNDGLTYPEYAGLNYNYADEVRGEINVDPNGNVYVASSTYSFDFPVTPGAYQTVKGDSSSDGVIFKMDGGLTHLLWSSYLGGNGLDAIHSFDFDPQGNLYLAGGTISRNFPVTAAAVQTQYEGSKADGFVARLSSDGRTLMQSSFYGRDTAYNQVYFVRTDKEGNVYLYGQTFGSDGHFIHNAAYGRDSSGQFISKLTPALDSIIWSTAFGSGKGIPDLSPTALMVDDCDRVYITGWGSDFFRLFGMGTPLSTTGLDVTPNAVQGTTDGNDFYIMVLESDASALVYASYFGSPSAEDHVDGGSSRFDKRGVIYQAACAGCAGFSDFPTTPGAVSRTNNSPNCNNAVFKLDLNLPIVAAYFAQPAAGCAPYTVQFNSGGHSVMSPTCQWIFGDGSTSVQSTISHTYNQPGIYTAKLIVTDPAACNGSDTMTRRVLVLGSGGTPDTLAPYTSCPVRDLQIGIMPFADTSLHYLWSPATGLSQADVANPFCNDSLAISYHLTVYGHGCADTFVQVIGCPQSTSGTDEIKYDDYFKVFPNPANDKLTIRLSAPAVGDERFEITDLCGQVVTTGSIADGMRQSDINVSDMAGGLYLVELIDKSNHYSVKKIQKL